ncbi:MAG TPA: hypothetical protein VGC42_16020 [Kofleriaceae bacterium]
MLATGSVGMAEPTTRAAPKPDPDEDPLWQAELRLGYGVELGGSGDRMTTRSSPVTLAAIASFAVQDEPRILGYGGFIGELYNRNAAGATGGISYAPHGTSVRLSGGGIAFVAPYSLVGATASGGLCRKREPPLQLCGDVQVTEYFAGSDLASGHAVTQIQLVLGAVFDVL